jgi:hypothetical protein
MVPQGMGAVSLVVGDLRAKTLRVGSDPMEENAFHGQVWGVKETTRKVVQGLDRAARGCRTSIGAFRKNATGS